MESGIPICWFTGGAGTFAEMTRAVPTVIARTRIKIKTVFLFIYFLLVYFFHFDPKPRCLSSQEMHCLSERLVTVSGRAEALLCTLARNRGLPPQGNSPLENREMSITVFHHLLFIENFSNAPSTFNQASFVSLSGVSFA
jgi:hypothetical protein